MSPPDRLRDAISRASLSATAAIGTVLFITSLTWTVHDYYAWRAFGTGGTSPTVAGYWRMTKVRFGRLLYGEDLTDVSPLKTEGVPRYLDDDRPLKPRKGGHARISRWTIPQRQRPEGIDAGARVRLHGLARALQARYPDFLRLAPSVAEGGTTDGIYAKEGVEGLNPVAGRTVLGYEIAHVHPADDALHVWLSEADARSVIEAGWGQRFPVKTVASGDSVDPGWIMVYAPRTDEEVDEVERIVKAGVGWLTGRSLDPATM